MGSIGLAVLFIVIMICFVISTVYIAETRVASPNIYNKEDRASVAYIVLHCLISLLAGYFMYLQFTHEIPEYREEFTVQVRDHKAFIFADGGYRNVTSQGNFTDGETVFTNQPKMYDYLGVRWWRVEIDIQHIEEE